MNNKEHKITVELNQEEANLILMGIEAIMEREPHGSDKISLADHLCNLLFDGGLAAGFGETDGR
jgi:hypothetical protein